MKKILLAICAMALALGSSMPASAATQTTTMPVSATIASAPVVSVTSLNFGSFTSGSGTYIAATNTITVNATNGLAYTVTLDAGVNYPGTSYRHVKSGTTDGGYYGLYKEASHSNQWGDSGFANTYSSGSGVAGTGSGSDQLLTVYGYYLGGFNSIPAGPYTDTVTVTVNY